MNLLPVLLLLPDVDKVLVVDLVTWRVLDPGEQDGGDFLPVHRQFVLLACGGENLITGQEARAVSVQFGEDLTRGENYSVFKYDLNT